MKMRIQHSWKGVIQRMLPVVLIAVLFSVSFHSCQKDESILIGNSEADVNQAGQLKSATISAAAIDALILTIEDYVTTGDLEPGIANALISKLENAKNSLERGNEKPAMNLLQAVIIQLEGLVGNGTIDSEVGEELINEAETGIILTDGSFIDERDGQEYEVVLIGEQLWMAENLRYLPDICLPSEASYEEPYYYVYGYEGDNLAEAKATESFEFYGVLYNWPASLTAAPEGWHLPTDEEWMEMEMYLGMSESDAYGLNFRGTDEGGKLKETGFDHWLAPNLGATNSSGFTALPSGECFAVWGDEWGYFIGVGQISSFWTSSAEGFQQIAWYRALHFESSAIVRGGFSRRYGISVRCVKD